MIPLLFATVLAAQLDAPSREPQMAANGGIVGLTFGAGKAIYYSASTDSGRTFSAPVKIAEAEILPLNRHRGPRIAMFGRTIAITAVTGKKLAEGPHAHGLPSDGDLWLWRSTDGGKSWSQGVRVNDVPAAATEGLHAFAGDGKGNLFAAWLDRRGSGTELYGSRSTDGGLTWSKNVRIYSSAAGSICQCCHPSVAIASEGRILVMWRNWLDGSRDMYLSSSRDGVTFSKAEKIGNGTWPLNACPMDGGGIAVSGNKVVTGWRRDGEIFMATPGEQEVKLGKGIDVAIAADSKGGVFAVWSSPSGLMASRPGSQQPIAIAPKGTFPSVVALADGSALAAWEADGKVEIQPLPAK